MAVPNRLRKWHFLLLGMALILIACFLWYWDWRSLGIPSPLQAEHFITILAFALGFIVLGIFVIRLTRRQVTIMLVGVTVVNLATVLISTSIFRNYPVFFDFFHEAPGGTFSAEYVTQWTDCFLSPVIYAFHAGFLLLWLESLVMYFFRKPTDQPE